MNRTHGASRYVFCLLFLMFALAARANDLEQKIDALVRAEMEQGNIPGLSVAVVKEGKPILTKGYGKAHVELDVPATADTVYQLASVSKQFTAAAIMLLAEDGKLSLDNKVKKLLPEAPEAWKDVTVRHLLNHTSGIKSYTSLPTFMTNATRAYSRSEMLKLIYAQPMEFQPGEKWNYNNSAYYLLGVIIEEASGKDYDTFLQERIFKPLGMNSTRLNSKDMLIKGRANGYTRTGKEVRNAVFTHPSQPYSAGALISTVQDMAKWDAALYTEKVLKKSSLDQMWTATRLKNGKTQDYGFGWGVGRIKGHREVGHGGGITGFSTYIGRFVDDKLSIIVLCNLDSGRAEQLFRGIAGCCLPDLAPASVAANVTDKDPETTQLLKTVLVSTAQGKADPQLFTAEMRAEIFPDSVKEVGEFLKMLGEIKSITPLEQTKTDTERRYKYRITFEDATVLCSLVLNNAGKIAGMNLMPE